MTTPIVFANEAELQAAIRSAMTAAPAPAPAPAAPASWAQPAPAPAVAGWGAAPAAAMGVPVPLGVLVPLNLQGGDGGKVKVMLQFGPEYAEPNALRALLGALVASGAPVDVWYPKRDDGGRGRGGWR